MTNKSLSIRDIYFTLLYMKRGLSVYRDDTHKVTATVKFSPYGVPRTTYEIDGDRRTYTDIGDVVRTLNKRRQTSKQ
ncbi:MAG: hypothetical protein Q4E59_00625 [Bacteroidales bacterium]|nr:hypothetical protein [Bacteroidales bacterium]